MGDLYNYFTNNSGKVIHKWVHYFEIYETAFSKYRNSPILLFEIGVYKGGSLQMWKNYFHPDSRIVGIDIDPSCKNHEDSNIFVEIGDQSDEKFLRSIIEKYGNPDIIIDDGSHIMSHINKTFDFLYPLLKNKGVYLVEDLHTAYWDEYEGGLKRENTFIEYSKSKLDDLNAIHSRGALPESYFSKNTKAIHAYDSIIFFEKEYQSTREVLKIGKE